MFRFNVCDVLKRGQLGIGYMMKYSNFPKTCPFPPVS